MTTALVDALEARGLVCTVGAGGKKSTCYALAAALDRAIVTATVRIPIFDDRVASVAVTEDPRGALERVDQSGWPLGLVPSRYDEVRYEGYDIETVGAVGRSEAAEAVLVKADGARNRLFKAPGEHEPQIPATADTVLPVASVKAVGEPLTEAVVHRPERVAELTGRSLGSEIRPVDIARVLTSEVGGCKSVPSTATVVPIVNMCDTPALTSAGLAIAEAIHAQAAVPRVALTRMDRGELVRIVQ
jgi:probable selenium-dependent hydroxylase accessory protein YqeC